MRVQIDKATPYLGERVVPLHALCNGLVSNMQDAIKEQNELLEQALEAIDYLLSPENQNYEKLRALLYATETDDQLTRFVSKATGIERRKISQLYGCLYIREEVVDE